MELAPNEQEIALGDAPKAVQEATRRIVGNGTLTAVTRTREEGRSYFEIDYAAGGTTRWAWLDETGEILQSWYEIPLASVPAAVRAAAVKAQPTGMLTGAGILRDGDQNLYELDMVVGGVDHEIDVTAEGRVVSDEAGH